MEDTSEEVPVDLIRQFENQLSTDSTNFPSGHVPNSTLVSRRSFIKLGRGFGLLAGVTGTRLLTTLTVTGGITGVVGGVVGIEAYFRNRAKFERDEEERKQVLIHQENEDHRQLLLRTLICPDGKSCDAEAIPVFMYPADAHGNLQAFTKETYPIELEVMKSFVKSVSPFKWAQAKEFYGASHETPIREASTVVAFGGGPSNSVARFYLGTQDEKHPSEHIYIPELSRKIEQKILVWATGNEIITSQYNKPWRSKERHITHLHDGKRDTYTFDVVEKDGISMRKNDALVVTVLPGAGGHRVVILAGAHGPGTRAARFLFDKRYTHLLKEVEEQTDQAAYWQGLFWVTNDLDGHEIQPKDIELKVVERLVIS